MNKYYDKEHNPNGTIFWLGIAENSLMSKELIQYMEAHFHLTPSHLKYRNSLHNGYVNYTGISLPLYFNTYFKPLHEVLPRHVVPGNGLGSLLAQFVWSVCDKGEGVLLPTPYYADYPRDIHFPAQAVPVAGRIPVGVDPLSSESIAHVRECIIKSNEAGTKVKMIIFWCALLVCQLIRKGLMKLAEEFDLHFLADEVYALQTFPTSSNPTPTPFVSVLAIDWAAHGVSPARIHALAGPTKDFGASGIKVGALISQANPAVVGMLTETVKANPMSAAADALFTQIINDRTWCDWFLAENRRRLRAAYERAAAWATWHGLRFQAANAGVFFVLDLAPLIDKIAPKELKLGPRLMFVVKAMLKNGIFLRPTDNCEDPVPTNFRMTYTLPEDIMRLSFKRLEKTFNLPNWNEGEQASLSL
ncbi:hypothetical protein HWV62_10905 [Athelia sp. TMB]|nr:hypothetical protein HWV62_10905 [Athelia sp. TMB]